MLQWLLYILCFNGIFGANNSEKTVNNFLNWQYDIVKEQGAKSFLSGNKPETIHINIKFQMVDDPSVFWVQQWNLKDDTLGIPSPHYFFISIKEDGLKINKKVKVYWPNKLSNNGPTNPNGKTQEIGFKFKEKVWDIWKNQWVINYNIYKRSPKGFTKENKIIHGDRFAISQVIDPSRHQSPSIIMDLQRQIYNTPYQLKGFFKATEKSMGDNKILITYQLKSGATMEVLWDKEKKTLLSYTILMGTEVIYQQSKAFNFTQYPPFNIEGALELTKSLNTMLKDFDPSMDVIFTKTFYNEEPSTAPNLNKYLQKLNSQKSHVLIVVPVKLIFMNNKYVGSRHHMFPVGILLEKFNNYWVLKKIINTNTCLNQFLLFNYEMSHMVNKIFQNNAQGIIKKVKMGLDPKNSCLTFASWYTDGNFFNSMTDYIQTRQSGSNSCYMATYKDGLKIAQYAQSLVHGNGDLLTKSSLKPMDFMTSITMNLQYDQWDRETMDLFMEQWILNHEVNRTFLKIHHNFLGIVAIHTNQDFGPVIGEENVVFDKDNVAQIRQLYHIFFLKINQEVFVYCVYRSTENQLDNQRYYQSIAQVINKYYPELKVHPMIMVPVKKFNSKNQENHIGLLYGLLHLSVSLPLNYKPLLDSSAIDFNAGKKNYIIESLMVYNMDKTIALDPVSEIYAAIMFLNSKEPHEKTPIILKLLSGQGVMETKDGVTK